MAELPITPMWFKQRQCKVEPAGGDNVLKVTGPNLGEAYLYVAHGTNQGWKAGLRAKADGSDLATADAETSSAKAAWEVAFELYRTHFIA